MAEQIIYWTLADSGGTSWYVYPHTNGTLVVDSVEPTDEAVWQNIQYDVGGITGVSTASSGIIYVTITDSGDTPWYVYPNTDGELIITDTEPS